VECRGEKSTGGRVPDLELRHPRLGLLLGEAEIGSEFDAADTRYKLVTRATERFKDSRFLGFEYVVLIVYPEDFVREASRHTDNEIPSLLKQANLGIGLAGRPHAAGLEQYAQKTLQPRIEWLEGPARPAQILQAFEQLADRLMFGQPQPAALAETLANIIDGSTTRVPMDENWLKIWSHKAELFGIDCRMFRDTRDCAEQVVKTLFTLCASCLIVYELARSRGLGLTPISPVVVRKVTNSLRHLKSIDYVETIELVLECLEQLPDDPALNQLLAALYEAVSSNVALLRSSGWEVLADVYQRLLSETFRKAYATFYTKLSAAHLLARLAVDSPDMRVIDPAMGSGSLLLATFYARQWLALGDPGVYGNQSEPALDRIGKVILKNTVGLDAQRGAVALTAAVLSIASLAVPRDPLSLFHVRVGEDSAGSLELISQGSALFSNARTSAAKQSFDLVIMNPPFTRSDRVSTIVGGIARQRLHGSSLAFGTAPLTDLLEAGFAKPFLALADTLVKPGGRIAAVIPTSLLNRPAWEDVRQGIRTRYDIEYVVISWAPGTPNFSSDTDLREILVVMRKRKRSGKSGKALKVLNLMRRIDELPPNEAVVVAQQTQKLDRGGTILFEHTNKATAEVTVIPAKDVRSYSDNLYRLIAFRNLSLLKMHLGVLKFSSPLTQVFDVGSVVDHSDGLKVVDSKPHGAVHQEAVWGSGIDSRVLCPLKGAPKHFVVVVDHRKVKVKFWKKPGNYQSNLFILRRGRLSTQCLLMFELDRNAISNVWWPLRPKQKRLSKNALNALLIYMNSVLGLIHMLGERLETEGLWVEYKKEHFRCFKLPDFDKAKAKGCVSRILSKLHIDALLSESLTVRYDEYVRRMSELETKHGSYELALQQAKKDTQLSARASIDLAAIALIRCFGMDLEKAIGDKLYTLVSSEIEALNQMGGSERQKSTENSGRKLLSGLDMVGYEKLDTYMNDPTAETTAS